MAHGDKLIESLWKRHDEECDKALEALNRGDNLEFEFYRGSAAAILRTINDLTREAEHVIGNCSVH